MIVAHSYLRTPEVIVFAYQGDRCLWGYAEVEGWKAPPDDNWIISGEEWGGAKWRRLYMVRPCSIREFTNHVSYPVLRDKIGFDTRAISFAPGISNKVFQELLRESMGVINLCNNIV